VALISVALLVLFGALVEYAPLDVATDEHVAQYYPFLSDTLAMLFIGFGFLMSFLYCNSYTAVGINFFASCVVMLLFIVVGGAVQQKVGAHRCNRAVWFACPCHFSACSLLAGPAAAVRHYRWDIRGRAFTAWPGRTCRARRQQQQQQVGCSPQALPGPGSAVSRAPGEAGALTASTPHTSQLATPTPHPPPPQVFPGDDLPAPQRIQVDMPLLIDAAFAACSGMIAFGAVIGRVTPTQLLWLMVMQVPVYVFNMHLVGQVEAAAALPLRPARAEMHRGTCKSQPVLG
jgi:hypothetical protein